MYRKTKALCPDGKVRIVYCRDADTFFTAPAHVRVRGKYVSGFVTSISEAFLPPTMLPETRLEFVAHTRNAHLVPDTIRATKILWYSKFFPGTPFRYKWIWEPSNQERGML